MDLRKRLELPAGECGDSHRIVMIRREEQLVGLIVDAVREVVWIAPDEIESHLPLITDGTSETKPGRPMSKG